MPFNAQDWELMVAQLESQLRSGKLTLQALWYYVQPPLSGATPVLGDLVLLLLATLPLASALLAGPV